MTAPKHVDFYEPGNGYFGGALEVKGAFTVNGSAVALAPGVTSDGDDGLTVAEALTVGETLGVTGLSTLTGGIASGADVDVTGSVAASGSVTAFGAADIGSKPAITGAISGTPTATAVAGALKLLLTALANAGFVTDSTT